MPCSTAAGFAEIGTETLLSEDMGLKVSFLPPYDVSPSERMPALCVCVCVRACVRERARACVKERQTDSTQGHTD